MRPDDLAPAPCGHRGCRLKPVEVRALLAAAAVLDDADLTRVCDRDPAFAGGPIPDFHSPRHVMEVKEVTSRPLRGFNAACDKRPRYVRMPNLRHLWAASVDVSAAAAVYEGDPEAGDPETPVVNTLISTVTEMVESLESRGYTSSLHDHDNFPRYAKELGFYCDLAVQPDSPLEPGILLSGTIVEHSRAHDLDIDVTEFLQEWLDSDQSANALQSLAGRVGVHVLVLMASVDGPAAGLIHTVQETPCEVPTAALRLPAGIDVLVVVTNTDVLRFTPADGWSRRSAPRIE
ncbi:MAG: hypothetical protein U1D00_13385 [Mycobacterium sp.]|nr:hypothetical protein [Mycobacterium sp.]